MYQAEARRQWDQAQRKVFWNQLLAQIGGEELTLLDFNEVAQRLRLRTAIYRGAQSIPVDKIVGSVGRYQDFTGAFLPVVQGMKDRWERVASIYLDPASGGVSPIEVYKVGDAYFVKDGNHRVSVAHQIGTTHIESYVWEYPAPVEGLGSDTDIDTLLIEAERQDFLEQTHLDDLRPHHHIILTAPGGYPMMLAQIARYQDVLSQIDRQAMSYADACTAWYDMIYETVVQIIAAAGVMDLFPERTPADFFVWTMRYQRELQERYGERARIADIARQIPRKLRPGRFQRWWQGLVSWLQHRLGS